MKHLKTALNHIRRTPYQSIAACLIMAITFFVAAFFLVLAFFSSSLLSYFEKQPQITVYFSDSKVEKEIKNLQQDILSTGKAETVRYISKEEALKIYQEDHKDDPLLLEMVTAKILPASLEIRAKDVSFLDEIAEKMRNESGVEDIIYQKDVIDKLVSWTRSLRALGIILLSILSFETLLVILNIVSMRIVNKRKDIRILQLLGASSLYVQLPFLYEGILYGLIGAFFGWLLTYLLLAYQSSFISGLLQGVGELRLEFLPQFTLWPLSPELMVLVLALVSFSGILLGSIGSFLAVYRYLK